MENNLEQLLKKLLELGRKPNGKEYNHIHSESNRIMSDFGTFYRFCNFVEDGSINRCLNLKLREIVSINSGLWQFVCENGMVKGYDTSEYYTNYRRFNKENFTECRYLREYQYRVIESSLKDDSELEDFLLNSIKID